MYRVYGKYKTDSRWNACDLSNGGWARNLIYANVFESKEQAEHVVNELNENETELEFQVRSF